MKVLIVSPEFPPHCGGIGYYVFYLTQALISRGVQVKLLVRQPYPGIIKYKNIEAEGVYLKGIPPFNNMAFRKQIEKATDIWKPDIIHVHSSAMPALKPGIPVIVTSHWHLGVNTRHFYRPIRDTESFYRNIFLPIYRSVEQRLVSSCQVLTVVSRSMADDYQNFNGVRAEVVWNGVDTVHFRPSTTIPDPPKVVFIGSLKRGKGVLDLMEAAILVNKQHNDILFSFFGDGPLRRTLQSKAEQNGFLNFSMPGSVSHDALPSTLANATMLVLPSYYEGLPNTLLEAMACGIPVIATNVKGNSELVQDGINGYLVPPHNPVALAEAICRIMSALDQGRRFGLAGRRLVEMSFTWSQRAVQFIDLYEKLLH